MPRNIMLIPTGIRVGLTSIILGVFRAIERKGVRLRLFKAISESCLGGNILNQNTSIAYKSFNLFAPKTISISHAEFMLSNNQKDALMEEIIANYYANTQGAEVVLIKGLPSTYKHQFAQSLNFEIAKILNAEVVLVMSQEIDIPERLKERIELIRNGFNDTKNSNIIGVIVNKINTPINEHKHAYHNLSEIFDFLPKAKVARIDPVRLQDYSPLPVLGAVPWNFDLITIRAIDIARHLNAIVINKGDINTRCVESVFFCVGSVPHILKYLCANSLLIISADRTEVLIAACLAAMNDVKISAILLTDGYKVDSLVNKLCERAFTTGLPVFMVNTNTWQTSINLKNFNLKIQFDDQERIESIQEYVADHINSEWIESLTYTYERIHHLSPPAFRYHLTELARKAGKRIVLPEGNEPRIVKAATICAKRGIANCVLLGDPNEITSIAILQGVKLDSGIEIINPKIVRESYVSRLVELRRSKGITETIAREQLEDNIVLGTLMLEQDEVDGLVSGAVNTTANTIRPPLQLIKTAPGSSLVSSIFFMLLPEQVYIYGDCAINPDPTAEQLAEIAIQSANSAVAFGIEPRVAMLSYSTGTSGVGNSVEKVREATRIAQKKRPDLMIDGPMQYDAAVVADVAKSKAPNSPVAGRATVFIFPDLNTGNTTYKAVQRSANLISIGPMLQGMRKPVNDLSRGALVDDIVYTVALTAIQSL